MDTSRSEQDKLKSFLIKLAELSNENIKLLKAELNDLRAKILNEKSDMNTTCQNLNSSWESLSIERDNKEREVLQRLTIDHESEISDYKRLSQIKEEEIKALRIEKSCLEMSLKNSGEENDALKEELEQFLAKHDEKIKELENRMTEMNAEKEKAAKDLTDKLNREHKTEIENIRSRFRLMMDRSPSDPGLEKTERPDISQEPAIKQMKEQFEKRVKIEVEEAVTQEQNKWQKKLEEMQEKYEVMMDNLAKRLSEDKDRQIDLLRERENNLVLECAKYKTTIQQLAECESQSELTELLRKVESLEKEKGLLQAELEKSRMHDLSASIAVLEGKQQDNRMLGLELANCKRYKKCSAFKPKHFCATNVLY